MEAEGAVAEGGDHRALRVGEAGAEGHGQGAADRARGAIDEPGVRLAARLDPLAELAAVGDQDRAAIEPRLERRAHAERMNGRARLSAERVPLVGHEPARRRDQLAPGAPPPAHGAARIRQSLREQGRIRHHPQRDAAAAVERLGIPVRLHEPTGRGEGGRPPEAHREVEPLAQEQDEIRPFQIGRRHVKPRVVHPARALHGEGGDSRRRGEALDAPRARRA